MLDLVLDSNVIGGIAASRSPQREDQLERVRALRDGGARILITPTVLTEIGAVYRSHSTLEKLIGSVRETCDGLLSLGADEILKIEATEADPAATVRRHPVLLISELDDLEAALQSDDVKAFHVNGGFGNKNMKHLLEALDPVAKSVRKDLTTFSAFVDDRRDDCLDAIVSRARGKGDLPDQDYDLKDLWKRGAAWRFMTLVYLANEFRRLTKTQHKGEGCLSDLRIVMEAAYSTEIKPVTPSSSPAPSWPVRWTRSPPFPPGKPSWLTPAPDLASRRVPTDWTTKHASRRSDAAPGLEREAAGPFTRGAGRPRRGAPRAPVPTASRRPSIRMPPWRTSSAPNGSSHATAALSLRAGPRWLPGLLPTPGAGTARRRRAPSRGLHHGHG